MKKGLAVLLCLCIAFLPAVSQAGARTTVSGFYKSFEPPVPQAKLPKGAATVKPALDLTVAPKSKPKTASPLTASTASPSPGNLPVAVEDSSGNIILGRGIKSITVDSNQDTMVVTQNAQQAIQNWSSFNIGAKDEVDFVQKNTSWVCLNRIFDQNPSQILGKISAVGQVYLINQNGILFGQGSQVNVHTMIASSLNILDSNFMNGTLNFTAQDYQGTGNTNYLSASVINQGTITTDNLGSVFLLGPSVQNYGTINTPVGQIGLAAGSAVSLYADTSVDNTRSALIVNITGTPGDATNEENAQLTAATGLVGMYGENVTQNGVITAVTALKKNGEIELVAANELSTGANSITSSLISTSNETADQSFVFQGGVISIRALDPSDPLNSPNGIKYIDLGGVIEAPSGSVSMNAGQRVLMENGSSIDVSGSWLDESASANVIKVQMNSDVLRDEPVQKKGILLGQYVYVNPLLGSSIGNISGALTAQNETALQQSVKGGTIDINSLSGDVIVKQGASINFSGGGINYSAGDVPTTKLAVGNKVYDISDAPENLHYDQIINTTTYVNSYVEGANAGTLTLNARRLVLDGQLEGSATVGVYQTRTPSQGELTDSIGNANSYGLVMPTGGALIIGNADATNGSRQSADFEVDAVVLEQDVAPLPSSFGLLDQPYQSPQTTFLSTDKLNAAGLSSLQIYTNTTLKIDTGARIAMNPGGSFTAVARQILDQGAISAPGGAVTLLLMDNITNSSVPLNSQIYLASGSSIDVSGQQINNSLAAGNGSVNNFSYIGGGQITLLDETTTGEGVIVRQGAMLNVSGGYGIGETGSVTGANAGTLTIQGSTIILEGDLLGLSLLGSSGGGLNLTAQTVEVSPSTPTLPQDYDFGMAIPDNLNNQLILGSGQLNNTGFTKISLAAVNNLTFDAGAVLSPSLAKLSTPVAGATPVVNGFMSVSPDLIGASSIAANAGVLFVGNQGGLASLTAILQVAPGAGIQVAPGGTIALSSPGIEVSGSLQALAGQISVTATQMDLIITDGAQLLAGGYNKPDLSSVMQGVPPGFTAMAGGKVFLQASGGSGSGYGNLVMEAGSLVDVSGSKPTTTYILDSGVPTPLTVAGAPGSISIAFSGSSTLAGTLNGQAFMSGLPGGMLSITSTNLYTISSTDLGNYLNSGFDDFSFKSLAALAFSGSMDYKIARGLTLDAPVIMGSGQDQVSLSAPYIQLNNSSPSLTQNAAAGGSAQLNLSGEWIDVTGSILFNGFQQINLAAQNDIRLSEGLYTSVWKGELETPGNLTLTANHIYPTIQSDFTLDSQGDITILRSTDPGDSSVYSAGGSLTIDANSIYDYGYLSAPMGSIDLNAGDRVYLAQGSVITTAGTAPITWGTLNNVSWTIQDRQNLSTVQVTGPPAGSVQITGNQVIAMTGSTINVSGGGSIFSTQFQAGLQGSVDPLQANGSFVIVPSGAFSVPGPAVYLEGGKGLPAGVYSILPEQYAFLPGAMVVTPIGGAIVPGEHLVTNDGYAVLAGYSTSMGTNISYPLMTGYEIRPASEVLTQGFYNKSSFTAGNAGTVGIQGSTTILNGAIQADAVAGFQGGSISLGGTNVFLAASTVPLPSGFDYNTPIPADLGGTLYIAASAISGQGFKEIDLGDPMVTQSVTMQQGCILDASSITLSALASITLDSGAQINAVATGGNGAATLYTPNGLLTLDSTSLVHASNQVNMTIGGIYFDPQATIAIDHGALNLTGPNVYFLPQGAQQPAGSAGLYLTSVFWGNFANIDNVNISASGGSSDGSTQGTVQFPGGTSPSNISLSAKDSFTINAAAIEWSNASDSGGVSITAPLISLQNRGVGTPLLPSLTNAGSLTLDGNEITVGEGPLLGGATYSNSNVNGLLIDGFSTISFNAVKDIAFIGSGSLATGAGTLNLAAGSVTTSYYTDANTPYTAANFTVSAANATVNITPPTGGAAIPLTTVTPGGDLAIDANRINVLGMIQMASANLTLNGTTGVTLGGSAQVLDGGSTQQIQANGQTSKVGTPGGNVYLDSESGAVTIGNNAVVDVSGVQQEDKFFTDVNDIGVNAGLISIYSPSAQVNLQGTLNGMAGVRADGSAGTGGSFELDAADLTNISAPDGRTGFSALNTILAAGGFNDSLDIRSRNGNLTVAATDVVRADDIKLVVDNGDLNVAGTINASGASQGGSVELDAGNNLNILSGSVINAQGVQKGGTISLNAENGTLNFDQGANLYVGGLGGGGNGSVYIRAQWTGGNSVNMNLLGTVNGASSVYAEAFQVVSPTVAGTISADDISDWQTSVQTFNTQYGSIQSGLGSPIFVNCDTNSVILMPGLEVRSAGPLTLAAAWDLSSWRYGPNQVPGALTIRAAGDLNIDNDLTDAPSGVITQLAGSGRDSWAITLVAGADLGSSDPMATVRGNGNLNIADGVQVYSESAPIRFASGNDTNIGYGSQNGYIIDPTIPYNLGSFAGSVQGVVGGDLNIQGGAIQTATGNIAIDVGGDLVLGTATVSGYSLVGSVRTTGQSPLGGNPSNYWQYADGGNITLRVAGAVEGNLNSNAWDYDYVVTTGNRRSGGTTNYYWGPEYDANGFGYDATQGIVAMAGGNVGIYAGGDFVCQSGTFGKGNLTIYSGGDILGRFLIYNGQAELSAMGNFGLPNQPQVIEAFAAQVNVTAQGGVQLGTVVNPTIANPLFPVGAGFWDLTYSQDSSVTLTAVTGNVTISGASPFYSPAGSSESADTVLPPTLNVYAGGDIDITNNFALAPSPTGSLTLVAGGNINGQYTVNNGGIMTLANAAIFVSDMNPNDVYNSHNGFLVQNLFSDLEHDTTVLHAGDPVPIVISAAGDISNIQLYLPKQAQINAGGDVSNIYYFGQNVASTDISTITAGGNITFSSLLGDASTGIEGGGPGYLIVQAAGSIDLGASSGIQSLGNYYNPALISGGSSVIVVSGFTRTISPGDASTFFAELQQDGVKYSEDLAKGDTAGAQEVIAATRGSVIEPFFGNSATKGAGNIDMISSQISTSDGGDIFVFSNGTVNVGQSTFYTGAQLQSTGIFTAFGGAINIFLEGDLNVNESRVMSFMGGDITAWSDSGSINAGRGSTTEIDASPPILENFGNNVEVLVFQPPQVGSGIRAVTYAPDGVDGPVAAPPAGNIYLFAPAGDIDAGEAGIAGHNLYLGAHAVFNSGNISSSGTSVGVPVSGSVAGLTSLTGVGSVSQAIQDQQAAIMNAASSKLGQSDSTSEAFSASLDVRVLSFFDANQSDSSWETTVN